MRHSLWVIPLSDDIDKLCSSVDCSRRNQTNSPRISTPGPVCSMTTQKAPHIHASSVRLKKAGSDLSRDLFEGEYDDNYFYVWVLSHHSVLIVQSDEESDEDSDDSAMEPYSPRVNRKRLRQYPSASPSCSGQSPQSNTATQTWLPGFPVANDESLVRKEETVQKVCEASSSFYSSYRCF